MINSEDLFNVKTTPTKTTDEIIDELLNDDDIRNFIMSNDLTHDVVEKGLNFLLEYVDDTYVNKENLKESKRMPGFVLNLRYDGEKIFASYKRVKPLPKSYNKIKSFNLPKELMSASFEDYLLTTDDRKKAYNYARQFVGMFGTKNQQKGLYLSGKFRSGKTYLSSAIANEIANKGYTVVEVYYPELSSIIKSSFSDDSENSTQEIVNELKSCDLLILDDFGGEAKNVYIRDEILGVVLNYRMIKNKAVIFTSNYPISKLADTSLRKDGTEDERTKALRIVERIKELTNEFNLFDKYDELASKFKDELF